MKEKQKKGWRHPGRAWLLGAAFFLSLLLGAVLPGSWVAAADGGKIVINKKTNQLAFYQGGQLTRIFAVATGRKPSYTPEGSFKVVKKLINPYYNRGKIKGGSPQNPLGPRWLGLSVGKTGGSVYGLHGNSKPSSIGTYASAGCIRMYNHEVIWLYDRVHIGTPVDIVSKDWDLPKGLYGFVQNRIPVVVKGQPLTLPPGQDVFSVDGLTLVPLQPLVSALGGKLEPEWDKNTLHVSLNNRKVAIRPGSTQALVDGRQQVIKPAPFYRHKTTYVPLRWMARNLGARVTWEHQNQLVLIDLTLPETEKPEVYKDVYGK